MDDLDNWGKLIGWWWLGLDWIGEGNSCHTLQGESVFSQSYGSVDKCLVLESVAE